MEEQELQVVVLQSVLWLIRDAVWPSLCQQMATVCLVQCEWFRDVSNKTSA